MKISVLLFVILFQLLHEHLHKGIHDSFIRLYAPLYAMGFIRRSSGEELVCQFVALSFITMIKLRYKKRSTLENLRQVTGYEWIPSLIVALRFGDYPAVKAVHFIAIHRVMLHSYFKNRTVDEITAIIQWGVFYVMLLQDVYSMHRYDSFHFFGCLMLPFYYEESRKLEGILLPFQARWHSVKEVNLMD